jgi:NlpC/P60 family putative phage cell wall peptidase
VGCDCLGLVRGIWRVLYGGEPEAVPHYSADWAEASGNDPLLLAGHRHFVPVDRADMTAGDVLLFRWRPHWPAKHLGVVSGEGTMIHAHAGAAVAEVHFGIWARRIVRVFRFPTPAERG